MQSSVVLTVDQVRSRLLTADNSMVRVQTLASWCLLNSTFHEIIVKEWRTILCNEKTSQSIRVGLLYVCHEIVYRSTSKEYKSVVPLFITDWTIELPVAIDGMFTIVVARSRSDANELRERTLQLIDSWKEMKLFPPAVIKVVEGTVAKVPGLGIGGVSAAGAVVTVSNDIAPLTRVHAQYRTALEHHARIPHVSLLKLEDKFGDSYAAQKEAAMNELKAIEEALRKAYDVIRFAQQEYVQSIMKSIEDLERRQKELCRVVGVEATKCDGGVDLIPPKKRDRQEMENSGTTYSTLPPTPPSGGQQQPVLLAPMPAAATSHLTSTGVMDDLFE